MVSRELLQLAPKWREAAGLDLDQQLAPDEVDDETVDELLDAVAGAAVPVLELSMQRTLVERSNRGAGCTGLGGRVHWQGLLRRAGVAFPARDPETNRGDSRVRDTDSATTPDRLILRKHPVLPVGCTNSIFTRLRIRGAGRRGGRAVWPAAAERER